MRQVTETGPRARWLQNAGLVLILSPIFLSIPGFEPLLFDLFKEQPPSRGLANAVSLTSIFVVGLGVVLLQPFVRSMVERRPLFVTAFLVSSYFLVLGLISAVQTSDLYPLLGALQYIVPIAAVVIGCLFRMRRAVDLTKVLYIFIAANILLPTFVFGKLYFWNHSGAGPVQIFREVNTYFYALFSHLPAMVLLACIFLLGLVRGRTVAPISAVVLGASLWVFFVTWSRASVVLALVALAVSVVVIFRQLRNGRSFGLMAQLGVALVLIVAGLLVPRWGMIGYRAHQKAPPSSESPDKVFERAKQASATKEEAGVPLDSNEAKSQGQTAADLAGEAKDLMSTSNASRISYMKEGLRRWWDAPLFGIMFKPDETAVIRRRLVNKKQIFQSHNQYIDVLLKSGLVGFFLMVSFYGCFVVAPILRGALSDHSDGRQVIYGVTLAVLVGVAVAANFQLYVTVWTTGVPLGFLMGYMAASSRCASGTAGEAGAVGNSWP